VRACSAMAVFVYNNLSEQFVVYEAGGLSFALFEKFLESTNEMHRCLAAFQVRTIRAMNAISQFPNVIFN
jgi:hypothetical protein